MSRELLEAAAKAAGIEIERFRLDDPLFKDVLVKNSFRNKFQQSGPWNPIDDDGDALRFAVNQHMTVRCYMGTTVVQIGIPGQLSVYVEETNQADPAAATRLAITRAAAEIGRNMP